LTFKRQVFIKAVKNDIIVGSVRVYPEKETSFIGRLIVEPDHKNYGIGTILMQSIEEYFTSADRYELFTCHQSVRNLYLYQKIGHREFKRMTVNNSLTLAYLEQYRS
jgi:GNAT superfamily N-acetyltransferase